MSNAEVLGAWFQQIWIDGNLAAIDAMFPPDSKAEGMLDFAINATDFKALVPAFTELVENLSISLERVVESGPWVAALVSIHGTFLPGSVPISFTGQIMARIEDGVFVEAHNNFDFITFLEQTGALPKDTVALALAGEPPCG